MKRKISEILPLKSQSGQYIIVLIAITVTALISKPFSNQQSYHIVSFLLLFVVSILAGFLSIGPILLASTISALIWNYFFIPPNNTFRIASTEDQLMFISFFFIALLNGILTNRIRRQERLVREREVQTNALFQLTGELSKARGIENVIAVAKDDFRKHFNADSVIFLQNGNNKIELTKESDDNVSIPNVEYNVAEWVYNNGEKAGKYTESYNKTDLTYYPLKGTRLNPGVIGFKIKRSDYGKKEVFWKTYFTQISNALEREFLGELALKARILNESDRLYKTLFNLISHEFRIPIATIIGASDTLLMSQTSEEDKKELLNEIFKASSRLNHLIENLLNMSRLEGGKISVHYDWCDINDLINKVLHDLEKELQGFELEVLIPEDMPLVKIDFGLMEQVLHNLILNSCQHAPASSKIQLKAMYDKGEFVLTITDNGPGFPEEKLSQVFNKFFRIDESKSGGLGLGLSIVKGLVESHKGSVLVSNDPGGGAIFTIIIPSEVPDINKIIVER